MITLTETTDNLQISLSTTVTTNQLHCVSTWKDIGSLNSSGKNVTFTNNSTDVNLVPSPSIETKRDIEFISVYNADTVNATITIKLNVNETKYVLAKCTLSTGERLEYNRGDGWRVNDNLGAIKKTFFQNSGIPVVNSINTILLTGDVTNNNVTANTLQDVTGLSFPVITGQTYWFKATIDYTAAATTTGSRWTINGPSFTRLSYMSVYSLTATTITTNNAATYQQPTACNASSGTTTGNTCEIEGFITPSANGNVQVQFASEITASAIVAKAGSYLQYMRLI